MWSTRAMPNTPGGCRRRSCCGSCAAASASPAPIPTTCARRMRIWPRWVSPTRFWRISRRRCEGGEVGLAGEIRDNRPAVARVVGEAMDVHLGRPVGAHAGGPGLALRGAEGGLCRDDVDEARDALGVAPDGDHHPLRHLGTKAPTLRSFHLRFPTEDSCLDHLMRTRFGERLTCFKCQKQARYYRARGRRSYACEHCG